MDKPIILSSEVICELPRGNDNPRNSEGDFALLKNGDILFAYSRYSGNDAHDDATCDIAGLVSKDGGKSFQPLDRLLATAKEHNTINIMSVSLQRLSTGELCLFYLCKKGAQSELYLKRAINDETEFSAPELCVQKKSGIYYVVNNCRTCVLQNGEVLVPVARHKIINGHGVYYGDIQVFAGDKDAKNWKPVSPALKMTDNKYSGTGLQEPGLTLLPDGRLYCYSRTDRQYQYECFSNDNGRTWSKPHPSKFTSPDSPMLLLQNPFSGIFYSLWNPIPNYNGRLDREKRWIHAGRTPFVIAQSDNGSDFSQYETIEDDPTCGYCYPAIFFLSKDEFLLSYCCGGADDGMCLTKTRIRRIKLKIE